MDKRKIILLILSLIVFQAICQDRVEQQYQLLTDSADSVNIYWDNTPQAREKAAEISALLEEFPTHEKSPFLLRFMVWSILNQPQSGLNASSVDSLIQRYSPQFDLSSWYFHNDMSLSYMMLAQLYFNEGKYQRAFEQYDIIRNHITKSVEFSKGDEIKTSLATRRAYQYYTNKGFLLYRTTHYLDPMSKKMELGLLIEKEWLMADSVLNINVAQESSIACEPTLYTNLTLLYGHYFRNDLKSSLYEKKALELLARCKNTIYEGLYDEYYAHLIGAKLWNTFALGGYEDVINMYQDLVPLANKVYHANPGVNGGLYTDLLFMLTSSYYQLNLYDSASKFGNQLLMDTAYFRDYSNLAATASMMADMALATGSDTDKVRAFLKDSRTYLSKAQHEAAQRTFIKEGEAIALRQSINRANRISRMVDDLDQQYQNRTYLLYGVLTLFALIGIAFFSRRLFQSSLILKQTKPTSE